MIGDQMESILQDKLNSLPMEELGEVFVVKVKDDTQRGVDPTGRGYVPYSDKTNKSGPVTMRDYQKGVETAQTMDAQAREISVGFTGSSGKPGTLADKPTGEVFERHQHGKVRNRTVRKLFLEEEDANTAGGRQAVRRVEEILEDHFNE